MPQLVFLPPFFAQYTRSPARKFPGFRLGVGSSNEEKKIHNRRKEGGGWGGLETPSSSSSPASSSHEIGPTAAEAIPHGSVRIS